MVGHTWSANRYDNAQTVERMALLERVGFNRSTITTHRVMVCGS